MPEAGSPEGRAPAVSRQVPTSGNPMAGPAAPPAVQSYIPVYPEETGPSTDPYVVAKADLQRANLLNATEQQVMDYIKANYPPALARLVDIPELHQAIINGVRNGLEDDALMAEVEKTGWWQQRSEAQRKYDVLKTTDPVEYQAQLDKEIAQIAPAIGLYGLDEDGRALAEQALRLGYSDAQIQGLLADHLQAQAQGAGLHTGTKPATDADELLRIARQEYLIDMPRGTAEQWAIKGIRTGTDISAEWRSYIAQVADVRFGLDPTSGITPGDVMAPIRATIAQQLEVDPDSIDLLSPEYSEVMQHGAAQRDGSTVYRPMTTSEATQWARAKPEFAKTKTAGDLASEVVDMLGRKFGAYT